MTNLYSPVHIYTRQDLDQYISLGHTEESISIEFKRELPTNKFDLGRVAEELALDICQFLNSNGGVIVFGLKEAHDAYQGKRVAKEFCHTDYDKIARLINDKSIPMIHPKPVKVDISSIKVGDDTHLTTINVFPIIDGVACVYATSPPYAAKYPYRTHYGKKYYAPAEVEKLLVSSNRHIPLKLYEAEATTGSKQVTLYPSVRKDMPSDRTTWENRDATAILKGVYRNEYTLNISGIDINIPFSLTKDVWTTENNYIGILLAMPLAISTDRKHIYFRF